MSGVSTCDGVMLTSMTSMPSLSGMMMPVSFGVLVCAGMVFGGDVFLAFGVSHISLHSKMLVVVLFVVVDVLFTGASTDRVYFPPT